MCRGGGCMTRHSPYLRVRLGGVTIWRLQCTTCHAVFTVLPHFVWRYRQMRPEVARDALLATHGGLSLELCAVLYHISPMVLYRLVCAFGHPNLVTVLTRCGLPLPVYFLADGAPGTAVFAAPVPLLALPGLTMADDIGPLTVRTVQDLENHDATRSRWGYSVSETFRESSISTPLRNLLRLMLADTPLPHGFGASQMTVGTVSEGSVRVVTFPHILVGYC